MNSKLDASAVIYGGVEAKGIVFDGVALAFDADVEVARGNAKKAAELVKQRVA